MNDTIFFFFYNLAHQSAFTDNLIIFFAVYFIYFVILMAGLFLLFHHKILPSQNPIKEFINKWKEFVSVGVSIILALTLAYAMKNLIHTLRPLDMLGIQPLFWQAGYAFPSGHTFIASAIAFSLFLIHKKAGYVFMLFALLIGMARVMAGVHFPIDILGGFALGGIIAYLVAYFMKKL
jgi:undecaprenyl-diphosphatase